MEAWLQVLALGLSVAVAGLVDLAGRWKGLDPPGFRNPIRRATALTLVAGSLYLGVFAVLGNLGSDFEIDTTSLRAWDLFLLHFILVLVLMGWLYLGFARNTGTAVTTGQVFQQIGLVSPRTGMEILLGSGLGILIWLAVLVCLFVVVAALVALGYSHLLPSTPPPMIGWIVSLPLGLRLLVSVSAGLVEESFFRGFLQPRLGIIGSSFLFVVAHASYDQPFLLVGVTLLSLAYAGLAVWRQSIWAAVAAHTVFDAVQLLVVIPWALEHAPGGGLVAYLLDSIPIVGVASWS